MDPQFQNELPVTAPISRYYSGFNLDDGVEYLKAARHRLEMN